MMLNFDLTMPIHLEELDYVAGEINLIFISALLSSDNELHMNAIKNDSSQRAANFE